MAEGIPGRQQQVFDGLEDLRVAAAPHTDWREVEEGGHVSWPSSIEDADTVLAGEPGRFGIQRMNLLIRFAGTEEALTNFAFVKSDGRIVSISRQIGTLSMRRILVRETRKLFIPRERPDDTDYEILARELRQGAEHFRTELV